ncbi:MAG: Trm112 family protein [Candidatus Marinimicrobia bacterium]|nr:Trm112 family protein [Candidatus Neomarinimicrobiota bacterium]MBL7022642.1 Trm112 family protein [Candidatus Neomarinimicrobiota bacterium]
MSLNKEISEILVCPKCKGDLEHEDESLHLNCVECKLLFPIKNGIPIMLVDYAESLTEN